MNRIILYGDCAWIDTYMEAIAIKGGGKLFCFER